MPENRENKDKGIFGELMRASTVGLNLVAATFVGLAIGYFLDKLFGTRPYLTIIFLILGIIAGFRELVRMAKRDNNKDKDDEKKGDRSEERRGGEGGRLR